MVASTLPANPEDRDAFLASILSGLRQGKSFTQLSEEFGIPASTLNRWMITKIDNDQYAKVKEAGVVARIAETIDKLEAAPSHVEIARARESGKLWCWLGERVVPGLAPKQEISGLNGGPIVIEDRELARRYAFIKNMAERNVIDVDAVQHEKPALTELSTDKRPDPAE